MRTATSSIYIRSIILGISVSLTLASGVKAQSVDFQKMTPDERKAYMEKMRVASQADWEKTMQAFNLKQPALIRKANFWPA
ncbi:hypothetical protein GCM10027341_30640 [Spirosoma knui]